MDYARGGLKDLMSPLLRPLAVPRDRRGLEGPKAREKGALNERPPEKDR
jgi:hypothetical protein